MNASTATEHRDFVSVNHNDGAINKSVFRDHFWPNSMARIELAWELGAGTGHFAPLLRIGMELQARGHTLRLNLREPDVGLDLPDASAIPREGAPIWVGPNPYPNPVNFGQLLLNFGYADRTQFAPLLAAWRERLAGADLVIANVAPAALLAARTLGIPAWEISQGFHVPPPGFPTPAFREWENSDPALLQAADKQVLDAINLALGDYGSPPIPSLGDLFDPNAMLLTFKELDIYPDRQGGNFLGIVSTGERGAVPVWPAASGPRVFAYLYSYYVGLPGLLSALADLDVPTLIFCRGIDPALKARYESSTVHFSDTPMAVSEVIPRADLVICHGSHQMTAQALLAGKPLLLLPTHVEQALIARRVERIGAGIGITSVTAETDFSLPLALVVEDGTHAACARQFAAQHGGLDQSAVASLIADRCESLFPAQA